MGYVCSTAITVLAVNRVTSAVVAFPIYVLVFAVILVVLIAGRLGPRVRARRAVDPSV